MEKQDVLPYLLPHKHTLVAAVQAGWSGYHEKIPAELRLTYGPLARAVCVRDNALWHLEMDLGTDGPVCVVKAPNLTYVYVTHPKGAIAVKVNKLDKTYRSCNYPDEKQLDLLNEPLLPGPVSEAIILGYTLEGDELEARLCEILFSKETKEEDEASPSVKWKHFLWRAADDQKEVQTPQLVRPQEPVIVSVKPLIAKKIKESS